MDDTAKAEQRKSRPRVEAPDSRLNPAACKTRSDWARAGKTRAPSNSGNRPARLPEAEERSGVRA